MMNGRVGGRGVCRRQRTRVTERETKEGDRRDVTFATKVSPMERANRTPRDFQ